MKILVMYDPHGNSNYVPTDEEIEAVDKVVFGGDYFDSFTLHPSTQIRVFKKLLKLKEKYKDKIEFLLGNHDIQYLYKNKVNELRCSGFSFEYFNRINELMTQHEHMFKYAYQYENHLFTHAGVHQKIIDAYAKRKPEQYHMVLNNDINLADLINGCKINELYYIGKYSGGSDPFAGIFWIRPEYLDDYKPEGYIQHVGHTHVDGIDQKYLDSESINYYDGLGKTVIEI